MAESEKSKDLQETLQPFYDRASQAEIWKVSVPCKVKILAWTIAQAKERLSRLQASLANKKDGRNEELLKTISELQSKLEDANAEVVSERKKAEKLAVENEKLNYRVKHLIRALEAADLNSKIM
ncbi:hypothetical protein Patl1_20449 [Pistacia atlantica]|uniref:Uncharacterized protein n=1 Tax=Pistacia atlantica TaxID=434234 RepID=A0ACC1BI38_9ROSI|nr:hypothetical protein Patl1_20449 [Pistacia atlantica]